jgi:hypothetical protein
MTVSGKPAAGSDISSELLADIVDCGQSNRVRDYTALERQLAAKLRKERIEVEKMALRVVPPELCLAYCGNAEQYISAAIANLQFENTRLQVGLHAQERVMEACNDFSREARKPIENLWPEAERPPGFRMICDKLQEFRRIVDLWLALGMSVDGEKGTDQASINKLIEDTLKAVNASTQSQHPLRADEPSKSPQGS